MVPVSSLLSRYLNSNWMKKKKMKNVLIHEKPIVAKENGIHSWWTVSIVQLQVTTSSDEMTYRDWRLVSCPNWDGMVPVSWLIARLLKSRWMKNEEDEQCVDAWETDCCKRLKRMTFIYDGQIVSCSCRWQQVVTKWLTGIGDSWAVPTEMEWYQSLGYYEAT
jgi:hypothetical protein